MKKLKRDLNKYKEINKKGRKYNKKFRETESFSKKYNNFEYQLYTYHITLTGEFQRYKIYFFDTSNYFPKKDIKLYSENLYELLDFLEECGFNVNNIKDIGVDK
jgi:hypothetical protein